MVLRDGPSASMNAIAAEAGITKPILYRHFGDKEGLYRALAKRHTDALLGALRTALDAPAERRRAGGGHTRHLLRRDRGRPQVYRFLMHPAEGGSPSERVSTSVSTPLRCCGGMGDELAEFIEERVDLGPDGEQLARVWGHGMVGMMHAAGDWWLRERPCARAELVAHLADLLWGGLAAAGDKLGGPAF